MERLVDLHNHTPLIPTDYGDAAAEARHLVAAALAAGIEVLGVADHSSVAYVERMLEAAREADADERLLIVPGAELKVRWEGDETHLVVLLPPDSFQDLFAEVRAEFGIRPDISVDELPWVTVERDPRDVARFTTALGGTCHVGHADRAFGDYRLIDRPLMRTMACEEFGAVELIDAANAVLLPEWCAGLPLLHSSDAHAPAQMGRRTARLEMAALTFDALRVALTRRSPLPGV